MVCTNGRFLHDQSGIKLLSINCMIKEATEKQNNSTSSAKHNILTMVRQHSPGGITSHLRLFCLNALHFVQINGMIPQTFLIHAESFMMTGVTLLTSRHTQCKTRPSRLLLKNKKISQRQLRSIARELVPFWRFEPAKVDHN